MTDTIDISKIVGDIMPMITSFINLFFTFYLLKMLFGMLTEMFRGLPA